MDKDDDRVEIKEISEIIMNEKILKIGVNQNDTLYLKSKENTYKFIDYNFINASQKNEVDWIEKNNPKRSLARDYLETHQGKGISLHRVITELHNGKILGSFYLHFAFKLFKFIILGFKLFFLWYHLK